MRTFLEYILNEAPGDPPAGGATPPGSPPPGGAGAPPADPTASGMPPADPSAAGGMPPPDMGGGGMPPMGGGGGGGMPPGDPSGGMGGQPPAGGMTPPTKYKPSTIWDVMEKILSGKPINDGNEDADNVKSNTQPQPTYPSPPVQQQAQQPLTATGPSANPGQTQVPAF